MMVIFTSVSEKKAIYYTRRILDAYAERIGNDTWKTIITEKGLETVKLLLKQTATKNMAVSCHWIRGHNHSELMWIVGNRNKFNSEGVVPVNSTKKNIQHNEWENDWYYLPQIKILAAMAGLLHDWGKTNAHMQEKLHMNKKIPDPIRHEWISCKLVQALVIFSGDVKDDAAWLNLLINNNFTQKNILDNIILSKDDRFEHLPPLAQLIIWLILSHHKLPVLYGNARDGYANVEKKTFSALFTSITNEWGYKNITSEDEQTCYIFKNGLLQDSPLLIKAISKWSKRLLESKDKILALFSHDAWRLMVCYTRLCVMLSDHYISSKDEDKKWTGNSLIYANTDKNGNLKQKLDEHLVCVSDQALKIAQRLPVFSDKMEKAYDVKNLQKSSLGQFAWQDRVVSKIKGFCLENKANTNKKKGWFIINMASTGCGKTIANAKIMRAISENGESLRYILATGLRTLTLQTGDEYRLKIGLNQDELAVLIGSSAVSELRQDDDLQESEELLEEKLEFVSSSSDDFLDIFFDGRKVKSAEKNKAFLYKPILVVTIDYMMKATETIKGGRYILPFLRLMSSDLVIDEIDDFNKSDLTAIARLVHLAGMLGRSVILSSATIPPDLAEGFFSAYQSGWKCYNDFFNQKVPCTCVWCDEFKAQIQGINNMDVPSDEYRALHNIFITKRVEKLHTQIVKRKAFIIDCSDCVDIPNEEDRQSLYFTHIRETAEKLHDEHGFLDKKSNKKISFALIRMANIQPCIALSHFLMETQWSSDVAPKIMSYHSRQVLLLRNVQENHLDKVLKRKDKTMPFLDNPIIRNHIENTDANNILFVVVATPVEEIGRDHDFDWAIIEPSSYRSFIQLAGRVLRHRKIDKNIVVPNIGIMQYNLKGLVTKNRIVFMHPGFECHKYQLQYHDLKKIVDEREISKQIDAVPRILKPEKLDLKKGLIHLEHFVMQDFRDLSMIGPATLNGWQKEYWWLTGLPQLFNRFRAGNPQVKLYLQLENGQVQFCERTQDGEFIECDKKYGINIDNTAGKKERLWLFRDYKAALRNVLNKKQLEINEDSLKKASQKYGEISIPEVQKDSNIEYIYSDQFGLSKK
ncbi:type I-F CRISPR-associated helicase Cas3f [Pectinatus frisingensis]|uniref:type I-F CRISPR-associated helicase Cas3f n=1 Tax=Pectinatus frisingensis TaxID=865 RepID=UPI0018C577D0|nr:type I-F CRISPR-associated helicase Cas3f [Pectinatus frisingensis]